MAKIEDNKIHLSIHLDFSQFPGPRTEDQGPFSGERFVNELLRPTFFEAEKQRKKLVVNLDGTEGYSTAFLDGSFGVLAREIGSKRVLDTIEFITKDEPSLKDEIVFYMQQLEK